MFITPILFLVVGYSLMYVVGRPVIQFASSSLKLFLLADVPTFERQQDAFAAVNDEEIKKDADDEIPSSQIEYPKGGYQYGEVIAESLDLDMPLYYGDTDEILRQGAGQYMGSVYPGEVGTSLIGAHNGYGFGKFIGIEKGDIVKVKTTYANYEYKVTKMDIRHKDDPEIEAALEQRDTPKIIFYTCYPVDSIGMTDERVFVFCDLVKGPVVNPAK